MSLFYALRRMLYDARAMGKTQFVLLLSAAALFAWRLDAQSKTAPELDHTTVYVRDVAKSAEFYEKVIGLKRIPDPFKDKGHVWLRSGAHQQLHVVAGATQPTHLDIEVHSAFRVASVEEFARRLDQLGVAYRDIAGESKKIQTRPDGVHQIYFQDPDGYWIEINDDKF